MNTRTLGKTSIHITPIGLGCWQFSQGSGVVGAVWDNLAQNTMTDIVGAALAGGINWFDTAEVYGNGRSELALAQALKALGKQDGDAVLATKWWPLLRTAKHLVSSIGDRQAVLAPYSIDLLQIHQPFSLSSVEKQAKGLVELLKTAKVKSVGVSNFSAKAMATTARILESEGLTLASNQVHYNLVKRGIERDGTLEVAKERGITIIAYSPLAQGLLTGRFHDDPSQAAKVHMMRKMMSGLDEKGLARTKPLVETLGRIASRYQVAGQQATRGQVALNWLINYSGDTVVAIPGASKVKQAVEAAGAMGFTLSADDLAELDQVSSLLP